MENAEVAARARCDAPWTERGAALRPARPSRVRSLEMLEVVIAVITCALSFCGAARAQAAAQIGGAPPSEVQAGLCTIADVFGKLQGITTNEDCRSGCARGTCPSAWMPTAVDECNPQCGRVFEPFWDQCGEMLVEAHMGGMEEMGLFYDDCLEELYPPGSCGTFCNEHTYDCYLTEVHQACCDEDGTNCRAGSDVPNVCPVGCAIVFPEFLETCREHVAEHEATDSTIVVADFEAFEQQCLTSDGLALVEYALELASRGCRLNLSGATSGGRHRHLQDFLMQRLSSSADQCAWDEIDDLAADVTSICCAGDTCSEGSLVPISCSPGCAVALHQFTVSCGSTLLVIDQDYEEIMAFEQSCLDAADPLFFLNAIKNAQCGTTDDSQPPAIEYATSTTEHASEMLSWDFSTAQQSDELIDGDRGGTGVRGVDLVVGVRLSQRCATSSFAVYGSGELRGMRVAYGVGGTTWSCYVRRDGGSSQVAETVCSEGTSSAPSGSVFFIDGEAEFVQFASWGDSVIQEIELLSCTLPAPSLTDGLVAHLHMDSEASGPVTDSSPFENHCQTSGAVGDGRFCRGLSFTNDGPQGISVASAPSLEFGMGSFSVMGWAKFEDYTYPRTSFVAKNGHGCYFHQASEHESGVAREGWNPGWEIGHGFTETGSDVCIRDSADHKARAGIRYDTGSRPLDLQGQWAHYAFVFDRTLEHRVFVYINGVKQQHSLDISTVQGSVDNHEPFTIGTLYGWKTDGTLDEYRMYNRALSEEEVRQVYAYVPPDC